MIKISDLFKKSDNSNICLCAVWHNFGMMRPGECSSIGYTVLQNGKLKIKEIFGDSENPYKTIAKENVISASDMKILQNFETDETCKHEVDACDGEAWEFTFYDSDGQEKYSRPADYIYGIKKLEKIADVLNKYHKRSKTI